MGGANLGAFFKYPQKCPIRGIFGAFL